MLTQSAICQNSTESGCRCRLHHPGLLGPIGTGLEDVTYVEPPAPAPDPSEKYLAARRSECAACNGNAQQCIDGAGAPHYGRLTGCNAWDGQGTLKLIRAAPAARQPWEVRRAA